MRDLHSNLQMVQSLDPAVTLTDRMGAPIDRQGYESVEHLVLVGTSGDALSPTLSLSLRLDESEDGSSWAPVGNDSDVVGGPVDPGGLFAVIDNVAADGGTYAIGYIGNARYSRKCGPPALPNIFKGNDHEPDPHHGASDRTCHPGGCQTAFAGGRDG